MNDFKRHKSLSATLFSTFIVFLINTSAQAASSAASEVAVVVPWNFIQQNYVPSSPLQGNYDMGSLQLEAQGIPVNIPHVMLTYQTLLQPLISRQDQTFLETNNLALQLNVNGFSVEKDIYQVVNGAQVIVHLQADCQPFTLKETQAHLKTAWSIVTQDTHLIGRLDQVDLAWDNGTWSIDPIICTGPAGFADLAAIEIQKNLVQSEAINQSLKPFFEKAANDRIESFLASLRNIKNFPIESTGQVLNIQFSGIESVSSKGLLFKALMQTGTPPATSVVPLEETDALLQQVGDDPTLIVNQKTFLNLFQDIGSQEKIITEMNQISAFQSLLGSWFKQLFVWPDLKHYKKTTRFQLISRLTGTPQINFGLNENFEFNGDIDSGVYADRAGKKWRSVEALSHFNTSATMSVNDGALALQFANQKLTPDIHFNSDYIATFHPSTRLSKSILTKAITQSPLFQGTSWQLPDLNLSEQLKLRAQQIIRKSATHFFIPFKKVP